MDILGIIPARGGSKGIYMKNLVKLNKKPLLDYSINSSLNSKFITKTIVSTDNKKIASYSKKLKAEIILRPKKLASDNSKIESTIDHSLNYPCQLNKKNFGFMKETFSHSLRPMMFTLIPFVLLFRWFQDYFLDSTIRLLGMSWFWFYLVSSIVFSSIFRKTFDVA